MSTDSPTIQRVETPKRRRLGLFSLILIGLGTGIIAGIFLGDYAAHLKIIGDAFVGLLRMSVLPYIVVSLIANVGRLSLRQGRRLLLEGGVVMVLLWSITLVTITAFSLALPAWKTGSFFSSSIVDSAHDVDLVRLFIPSNIFAALTDEAVPAVILFCIAVGVAIAKLSGSKNKLRKKMRKNLIVQFELLAKALTQVNQFVVRLTPIGVFAIAANAAGTLSLAEISRLQAYIISYGLASLLLAFVVLPALIITVTPFRYRDVWHVSRDALVMAFATGKLLVVLPLLIEKSEELFHRHFPPDDIDDEEVDDEVTTAPAVDVLYPLAYSVPSAGKLLSILFIPFSAWFLGRSLAMGEYPRLLAAGFVSSFGGPLLSTPFLLDIMHLPRDMFQLFLLSGVLCGRLADMLGVMHLATFTIVTTCAFTGTLRLDGKRIITFLVVATVTGVSTAYVTNRTLQLSLATAVPRDDVIAQMQILEDTVPAVVLEEAEPNPQPLRPGQATLSRIRQRGVIRIGFNPDKLPFAYFNIRGDLVGFDISMAHRLARDLGVTIEFVPFDRAKLAEQAAEDCFDVVMSGVTGTLELAESVMHTHAYLDVTQAIVVEDHRAPEFRDIARLKGRQNLKIGYAEMDQVLSAQFMKKLPEAEFVKLPSNRQYFQGTYLELDALLISAESGSAFTLFYPQFEVVMPNSEAVKMPLFYVIGNNDVGMRDFMEYWIELRRKDGTIQRQYDRWILGNDRRDNPPRWSILRDVLGWVP